MISAKFIPKIIAIIVLAGSLVLPIGSSASDDKLSVTAKLIVKRGAVTDAKMVLFHNDTKIREYVPQRGSEFTLELDYNTEYILSFEKPNYVTKKVLIDTQVPSNFIKSLGHVTHFDVEIFKQKEGEPIMVYLHPVAKIKYNSMIKEFDYDLDYSRMFQKLLEKEQKEIIQKKDEETKQQLVAQAEERNRAEQAKRQAEQEAQQKEQERKAAEAAARAEATAKAKEEARLKAEEELQKAAEKLKQEAEEKARRLAEQQRLDEERRQAEAEKIKQEEAARAKALEEARLKQEAELKAEAERRAQAEAQLREQQLKREAELQQQEEERKLRELKRKEEEEKKRQLSEEERRKKEDELRLKMIAERMSREIGGADAQAVIEVLSPEDIIKKYKRERVDEFISLPRITITRTVFNKNEVITFYTKVVHAWGARFFFKNGFPMSERQYLQETANN